MKIKVINGLGYRISRGNQSLNGQILVDESFNKFVPNCPNGEYTAKEIKIPKAKMIKNVKPYWVLMVISKPITSLS
ncbi:MAG: hypothetical protein ACHQF4_02310 [Sphingobacteriales bacterium]